MPILLMHGLLFLFDTDEGAFERIGSRHFDRFSPNLIQQLSERRITGQVHSEAAQRFHNGIARAIADGGNAPAAGILDDQAFQYIVNLVDCKPQIDMAVSLYRTVVLEVAHPAGIEHDF
jgi:hypothetical protein